MAAIATALERAHDKPHSTATGRRQRHRCGRPRRATAMQAGIARPSRHARMQFVSGHFSHRAGARDYRLFIPATPTGRQATRAGRDAARLHAEPRRFRQRHAHECPRRRIRRAGALSRHRRSQANAQGCWNWFKHNHQGRERGEPALLAAMARHIAETHGVDPAHIYVAGLSAGGAMAAILAVTHPDVFAAAGVHSGLPAGRGARPARCAGGHAGPGRTSCRRVRAEVQRAPDRLPRRCRHHGSPSPMPNSVAAAHGGTGRRASTSNSLGSSKAHAACTRRASQATQRGRVVTEEWLVHGAGHAWSGGEPDRVLCRR